MEFVFGRLGYRQILVGGDISPEADSPLGLTPAVGVKAVLVPEPSSSNNVTRVTESEEGKNKSFCVEDT